MQDYLANERGPEAEGSHVIYGQLLQDGSA